MVNYPPYRASYRTPCHRKKPYSFSCYSLFINGGVIMRYFHYILGIVMLVLSAFAHSVTINLTAKFTPAINNSNSDGVFTNTTPQSGYCVQYPDRCPGEMFSVNLPLSTTISYPIVAYNEPRDGPYFNFPKTPRTLTVRNQDTGESFDVIFRITNYSARYRHNTGQHDWTTSSLCTHLREVDVAMVD